MLLYNASLATCQDQRVCLLRLPLLNADLTCVVMPFSQKILTSFPGWTFNCQPLGNRPT